MKLLSATAVILLFSNLIFGKWALIPLDELVENGDLIVVGTLHSALENSEYEGTGYIRVDDILTKGTRTSDVRLLTLGANLKITWLDNWACAEGMHLGWEGKPGIWLLKIKDDGNVVAGYPGRFRQLDDLGEIKKLLTKKKTQIANRVDVFSNNDLLQVPAESDLKAATVVDVTPFSDYSLSRGLFAVLVSFGLYVVLYRSRFKIR